MHFLADGEVCVIRNGAKSTPLSHFFLSILYLYDSIFPEIVLIDKLHNFEEGMCFPNNDCHGKRIIFFTHLIIPTVATSKKCFIRNWNLINLDQHWKTGLIGLVQVEIKCHNLKNWHFEQKVVKNKNIQQFYFSWSTFQSIAHKMKTG